MSSELLDHTGKFVIHLNPWQHYYFDSYLMNQGYMESLWDKFLVLIWHTTIVNIRTFNVIQHYMFCSCSVNGNPVHVIFRGISSFIKKGLFFFYSQTCFLPVKCCSAGGIYNFQNQSICLIFINCSCKSTIMSWYISDNETIFLIHNHSLTEVSSLFIDLHFKFIRINSFYKACCGKVS